MLRALIILLLCCFSCTIAFSQAIGTWNGQSDQTPADANKLPPQVQRLRRSLVMQVNANGLVNGIVSVHYDKYSPQYTFVGRFDAAAKRMVLAIQVPKPQGPEPYYKVDSISYSYAITQVADSLVMMLQGMDTSRVDFHYTNPQQSYKFSMLPSRMRMVYAERIPLPAREKDIQHTIVLDTSFVRIDLYDNGEIDNDIVTLLLDGKTVVSSQPLSTKPVSLSLELSREPAEHLLEMFADNLGSIPPNTALLVLTCKKKRYELNLSSNGKVNGSVKLLVRP